MSAVLAAETRSPYDPPTDTVAAHLAKGDRRPATTIWRKNPRMQGLIGLGDAMSWFSAAGYAVSVPLNDSQPYDLVVDDGDRLQRVQVKTTTFRSQYGIFKLAISTQGGNQSFTTKKAFDPGLADLLYVLTDGRERYLIPTASVTARYELSLGRKVQPYRIAGPLDIAKGEVPASPPLPGLLEDVL